MYQPFKKGDVVILRHSANGFNWAENIPLTITYANANNATAKLSDGRTVTLYFTGTIDDVALADRKLQAEHIKKRIEYVEADLAQLKREYEVLTNFESEEEFIAFKLEKLLKAKDKTAIVKLLKELKQTHYL